LPSSLNPFKAVGGLGIVPPVGNWSKGAPA